MKLVRLARSGHAVDEQVGVIDGDTVVIAGNWSEFVLGGGSIGANALNLSGPRVPLRAAKLLSPVTPSKGIGIGLNYLEHAREAGRDGAPSVPQLFSLMPNTFIGPDSEVKLPAVSEQFDYEAELAVVIGRRACRVSAADAESYIFGYTCANDLSIRDWQMQNNWSFGKSADGFTPIGPWIVTPDEIGDPYSLKISCSVNDEIRQTATTDMARRVPELIEFITAAITLEPGDVILTGTPSGVGAITGTWLRAGDRVVVTIERIGELVTTFS